MSVSFAVAGKFDEAERCAGEALEGYRKTFGDDHPRTLNAMNNVGIFLLEMGRLESSEQYLRDAAAGNRRVLGEDHPRTLMSIGNIGWLLEALERYEEAEP